MRQFKIIAHIDSYKGVKTTREVKGFYYQGDKNIVLVGDEVKKNTIREKYLNSEVIIEIQTLK